MRILFISFKFKEKTSIFQIFIVIVLYYTELLLYKSKNLMKVFEVILKNRIILNMQNISCVRTKQFTF
jgi:hypothetical protein